MSARHRSGIRIMRYNIRMADIRKKTWLLDQNLIRRACRIYKSKTETEAVTRALQEVVFREDLVKAFRSTAGKIPTLEKVF